MGEKSSSVGEKKKNKYLQSSAEHDGHRSRMYKRLELDGLIAEHELLEIFLFGLIPRKDTNKLAHILIKRFGGIEGVFFADKRELLEIEGIGEVVANHIAATRRIFFGNYAQAKELKCNINDLRAELVKKYDGLKYEVFDIFAFDACDTLIMNKTFTLKNADLVTVDGKALSAILSSNKVFAIVASHNHPASTCFPSTADNAFTRALQLQCSMNSVRLYDHLIIDSHGGIYSYLDSGELESIYENFCVEKIIDER